MPTGKISGVKKTYILRSSAVICFVSALLLIFLSLFLHNVKDEWFFIFCFFCGVHQIIKGILFNSDSSSYFGSSLFFISILLLIALNFNIPYHEVFYFFALGLASLYIFLKYHEKIHLMLSFSFTIEGILLLLFLLKKINFTNFLIFNAILFFIFLIICVIILIMIYRKRRKNV